MRLIKPPALYGSRLGGRDDNKRHCERSEAIQTCLAKTGLLRRFAPRNDGEEYFLVLATGFCPRFANSIAASKKRARATLKGGRGEDRVRAAPTVSCAFDALEKCAHEHTGSAETLRPSLRNGLTTYTCSPWWPCCATITGVMRKHHRRLDASLGASGPHDFIVRINAARLATQRVHRGLPQRQ
jgi:hypothetical protein